ncbi:hybrid sensor histidine kinase/response regulator [Pilimelia columellifera]|uniref:hybrid sensor histidine kinase/response regulator n=1 Tax=Pilimelia columellifera TaxID=706574 RepID=UPI0031CEA4B1
MITLIAEFLLAVIFFRALWGYLRTRDAMQRDVTILFAAAAALFAIDLVGMLGQRAHPAVVAVAQAMLLLQPYLTLRLINRLHAVPRWLTTATLLGYLGAAVPALLAPRPLSWSLILSFIVVFMIAEGVAAVYLWAEARRRTGAATVRLHLAAWSTAGFAAAGGALGASVVTGPALATSSRLLALASAAGYLIAFFPPQWLRRQWSAAAAYTVWEEILRAPATDTSDQIWRRYAEIVRSVAGSRGVAVLIRAGDHLIQPTAAGSDMRPPAGCRARDLDELLKARQPLVLGQPGAGGPLARHYTQAYPGQHLTAIGLIVPPDTSGALLVIDEQRSLFHDDDLRMLADLGGQAGILAERGAVIAERGRLAEELADSVGALTEASQAKSSFLASMSHELRTPLNAIIGFSDLMRGERAEEDNRVVPADWVDHIHSSGRHLLGLINDVLDLTKVEAGRLDLQPVPLRVDIAAGDLITALRPLVDNKRLRTRLDLPPLTAHVDPVRFRQMLENLLSNAIKFTPEGGHITLSGGADGPHVLVAVTDTGVGIETDDQSRVFEEFQQVGSATQRQAGTGLGLALTRRLAQAHGGDIRLESTLGEGSRFTLYLPAAAPASAERPDIDGDGQRGRVLVIEDDLRAAELMRTHLTAAGFQVVLAASGEAGLRTARAQPPELVLLDVVLPGMHGWDVLRQFKNDPGLSGVPVVIVTVVDERRTGLAMGAAGYFVKPVDPADLLAALDRHLPDTPSDRQSTDTDNRADNPAVRPRRHVDNDHQSRSGARHSAPNNADDHDEALASRAATIHDTAGGAT